MDIIYLLGKWELRYFMLYCTSYNNIIINNNDLETVNVNSMTRRRANILYLTTYMNCNELIATEINQYYI